MFENVDVGGSLQITERSGLGGCLPMASISALYTLADPFYPLSADGAIQEMWHWLLVRPPPPQTPHRVLMVFEEGQG